MKTLNDFLAMGYRLNGDMTYQNGYVSRKPTNEGKRIVYEAKGRRNGQYYVLEPCYTSSRYCYRHYLTKA